MKAFKTVILNQMKKNKWLLYLKVFKDNSYLKVLKDNSDIKTSLKKIKMKIG